MDKIKAFITYASILLLRCYQFAFSPFLGNHCRFYPSCSNYAIEAIKKRGFIYGSLLIMKRISRCHPWCQGGIDPVPEKNKC